MAFHDPAEQRGNQFLNLKQNVAAFKIDLNKALPNSDNQLHNQRNNWNADIENTVRGIEE